MGASRLVFALIALVLMAAASTLLLTAQNTPQHSSDAFDPAMDALLARWQVNPNFDELSRNFHAINDRFRTNKWLYADLGYLTLTLGALAGVAASIGPSWRWTRSSSDRPLVIAIFVIAYIAFWLGSVLSALLQVARGEIPPWADTTAIPVFGGLLAGGLLLIPIAAGLLWPLAREHTESRSLFYFDRARPITSLTASVIYAVAGAALVGFALVTANSPGSWLATPALLALGWLAFNTRVLAIAPKRA